MSYLLDLKSQLGESVEKALNTVREANDAGQLLASHKRALREIAGGASHSASAPANNATFDAQNEVAQALKLVKVLREKVTNDPDMSARDMQAAITSTNSLFSTLMKYRTSISQADTGQAHARAIERTVKRLSPEDQAMFFEYLEEELQR